MKLVAKITEREGGNFYAWCPALPGCWVVGQSRQEARQKISEAIEGYLASLDVCLPRELARGFSMENASVSA